MVYLAIRRGRYAAVALCRDDRLDARCGNLGTDGKGNLAFVGGQRLGAAGQHPEQRAKALNVVRLLWRQHEPERPRSSCLLSLPAKQTLRLRCRLRSPSSPAQLRKGDAPTDH